MKKRNDNMSLEQLLATVEHAGRDARRQQRLAEMIDGMAGVQGGERRHGFWWYGARVAAAACILFFISTAVRVWFIPTDTDTTVVAEAGVPATVQLAAVDSTVAAPVAPRPAVRKVRHAVAQPAEVPAEEPLFIAEEAATAQEEQEPLHIDEADVEPRQEEYASAVDEIVSPVVSVGHVAQAEPQPVLSEPTKEQPRRRNILGSLFRQPEPDDMTGTMLALRLL